MYEMKPCCVILEPITPKLQSSLSAELRNVINDRNMLTTRTKKKILLDLDEINDTNMEIDRQVQRMQAVKEILLSEVSYLKQVELILNYFMKPIEQRNLLNKREFQTLFGEIQTIYNVNGELLQELKQNPEGIAKAFSNIAPFLKHYSVYAYNYKNCLAVLQKVTSANGEFSKFLQQQESRPEVQTKLSALLITPIQRVPRYRLLLKQILDNTSPNHASHAVLVDSLKKVEEAANHINNLVDDQENSQKLLEFQRRLIKNYPLIIKPGRKLIKEGVVKKISKNDDKKKYLVLLSDIIIYCTMKKSNPNTTNSLKCSGILPLNRCKITKILNKGAFNITCDDESHVFYHKSAKCVEEWVTALESSIKTYLSNRMTLRKDNSYRKPAHKKLLVEFQDLGVSPGQPRKKRESRSESNTRNNPSSSNDKSFETQTCFPFLSAKRKLTEENSFQPEQCKKTKLDKDEKTFDSLFPLRRHNIRSINNETTSTIHEKLSNALPQQRNINENKECEVFVFGQNNPPRGFNFQFTSMITNVTNSVKKMFGFRKS